MKKGIVLVGIVAILIFTCLIGVLLTSKPSSEATLTPEVVLVVEPSPTPVPTLRPTNTPEPSEGIGKVVDFMEFVLYLETISPATDIMGTTSLDLADQFLLMSDDPLVIFTESWKTRTALSFARMEQAADVLENTDAPVLPDWPITHLIETQYKCAGRETNRAMEDLAYGFENILPVYIEEGLTHLDASRVCVDRASDLIVEFTAMANGLREGD